MYNFTRTQASCLKENKNITFGDDLSHWVPCNVRPFHICVVTSWLTFKPRTFPVAIRAQATMSEIK